jgi:PTS system nitrogen regulatory IIA component
MNLVSKILPADNVVVDLDVGSKKLLFEHIAQLFETHQGIPRSKVLDSLLTREKLGSTGLGHGIAIPHGRLKGLKEASGAFIKTRSPIPFDAPDGQPVNLLFALLVPEQATDFHLQILGELAQVLSDKRMREQLLASTDPTHIHQLLTGWSPATRQSSK